MRAVLLLPVLSFSFPLLSRFRLFWGNLVRQTEHQLVHQLTTKLGSSAGAMSDLAMMRNSGVVP